MPQTAHAPASAPEMPLSPDEAMLKPVFLKGLFSVHTTSRRSRQVIRRDLIRVLDEMGIRHREIRGGFECVYKPSVAWEHSEGNKTAPPLTTSTTSMPTSMTAVHASGDAGLETRDVPPAATGIGQVGIDRAPNGAAEMPRAPTDAPRTEATPGGEGDVNVFFEVFVVKVPLLLGINGLQFRRLSGNAWQYQMLAKRILAELKL